jgi:hypothetical protein
MKDLVRTPINFLLKNSTAVIIIFSLVVQVIFIGRFLDNSVISLYAPTASDASDYTRRAELWQAHGFDRAFGDAYRMPGYPLLLLLMHLVFPSLPNLAMRILQLLAVALSAGLIKLILQKYVSLKFAIFISALYALLPIWHFVPILIGESLTSVTVVILLYLLAKAHHQKLSLILIFKISLCIAVATYVKPNNLLLLIPVLGFLMFSKHSELLKSMTKISLFVSLLLLPWLIFVNSAQSGFLGLTTNSGVNMYIGTGMIIDYDQGVLSKSAMRWKVDPRSNPSDVISSNANQSPKEIDNAYKQKALQIWQKRPGSEVGFGLDKVLIAFGFKTNSRSDLIMGLFILLGLLSAAILLKSRTSKSWGAVLLFTMATLATQAVLFQADRRFVVPVLFPFATICLGIALSRLPIRAIGKTLAKRSNHREFLPGT